MDCETTVGLSYTSPSPTSVRVVGQRQQLLKQQLFQVISSEVHDEFNPPPPTVDYSSTTKSDYGKGACYTDSTHTSIMVFMFLFMAWSCFTMS